MKFVSLMAVGLLFFVQAHVSGQTKRPRTSPAKVAAAKPVDTARVVGKKYTSSELKFELDFPGTWIIPDKNFEEQMKKRGIDLTLRPPDSLPPQSRARVNKALQQVQVLLTAYRSVPGTADNAVARISVEDLSSNPQIRDAVDYFDAMRAMYWAMKLPAGFTYSETMAEQLGNMQFGYLDTSSPAGKKRMYATVRDGKAIMFTLSYTKDEDLQTFRSILSAGSFKSI